MKYILAASFFVLATSTAFADLKKDEACILKKESRSKMDAIALNIANIKTAKPQKDLMQEMKAMIQASADFDKAKVLCE